jgi:hypothetical protein
MISVTYPDSRYWQEYQKNVKHFFLLFLDNTLPVRIVPVFLKFIEPELATTIISFLKPGVAGGNPCPRCPSLANWYD